MRVFAPGSNSEPTLIGQMLFDGVWSGCCGSTYAVLPSNLSSWYISVTTAAFPSGELRGPVPVVIAPTPARLSELQTQIFTPKCASCHDGTAMSLPGSLDLRPGRSFGSLVNVGSTQRRDFLRVAPSEAKFSYLIHKVDGAFGIVGNRMPDSGPPLSHDEIFALTSWIDSGAPNN
jgi:hypothetical protein